MRHSSALLQITSLCWQTLELLMVLHKHQVPRETQLSNARIMRHLDLAKGKADEETDKGAGKPSVPWALWEN